MDTIIRNPWPKRIGMVVLGLLSLLLIAFVAFWLWLNSGGGRAYVERTVEDLDIAGQAVAVDGLSGSVLGEFRIDRITLTGPEGPWLVARDITIDWHPRRLLGGTVHVDALAIDDLDILQRPVWVPSASDEPSRFETFIVNGVALPDVDLSEPVVGRAIQMSAQGNLRHGTDGGSALLTAETAQGDRVDADLLWSPLLVLSGEAEVDGAPGGLLASLLQLGNEQGITADVSTQDDRTEVLARIDGVDFTDLAIERSQSRIALSGTVQPDPLPILARWSELLGGAMQIDAVLPLDEQALASIRLRAPRLQLDASGQQRDDQIVFETVSLEAEQPMRITGRDDFSIGQLSADGQATLGDHITFSGEIVSSNIQYRDYQVDRLSGPVQLDYSDGMLGFETDMTGRASQGLVAEADGARLLTTGRLDLEDRTIALSRADIQLPGLSLRGEGQIGYGDMFGAQFTARYDLDSRILRDRPHARLSGQATLQTSDQGQIVDLTGRAQRIGGLSEAIVPIVPDGLNYSARLRLRDGDVRVTRFTASNEGLDVKGTGRWSSGQLMADMDYKLDQYDYAAVSASGIQGRARLSGPPRDLGFETDFTGTAMDVGALVMAELSGDATGRVTDGVIESRVTVRGDSDQGPAQLTANVSLADGAWNLSEMDGTLGDLRATGTLSGAGGDIAALRGDLNVSGQVSAVPAEQVDARIQLGERRADVTAQLNGVNYGAFRDGTIDLRAVGPRDAVGFEIEANGTASLQDIERPATLSASGVADLRDESLGAEVSFDLFVSDLGLSGEIMAERTEPGWGGKLNADGLGGTLSAEVDPGENGGLSFGIEKISMARLARLLARPVTEGALSGEGRFAVVPDGLEGSADLRFDDLRSPISDASPVSVLARIDLQNEQLNAVLSATEGGLDGRATIAGPVDTLPYAPFLVYPPTTPLQGQADLQGEIGPLVELFLPPRTDVAGRIDTDVTFTVPSSPTGLQGRIALSDGIFEQGDLGLRLQDITVVANLSGETIDVPTLSAVGSKGGTLRGSGRMGLGAGTGQVEIQAQDLKVVDRREGQAEVSGTLNMSRTAELLRLAGELRINDADLNIARLPEPGLPTLDIDFGDAPEDAEVRSFASSVTELDIRIVSNGRIKVRGRGLDTSMSLDARVRGAFDDPVVTGEMSIARGRFDFLSKRFEFRDSFVLLRDDIMTSSLALEAVRTTPDLTAVVRIGGTLERPEIDLSSEPTLPEDEVLSRILFGRSPTQLSAIEAARLAAALTQLSGGSGFDLFGSLENAVGLDTLEIGQSDTGQTQLTTGKYLSDNVYLEVRTAAEGTPGVAVEWQVRDNVSVEAETVPNERERLSVQWKRDFD